MTKLNKIEALVQEELQEANSRYPLFASNHEAYAVVLEEDQEAFKEFCNIKDNLKQFWFNTKKNKSIEEPARDALVSVKLAIAECIQVAAMLEKAIASEESRKGM